MKIERRSYADPCGVARALDAVGERWALLVVRELSLGPRRFGQLREGLPGISPNVLSFTRCADHVLIVTTPEPTAITDAYAVIKVVSKDNNLRRLSLLVNQVRSPAGGAHDGYGVDRQHVAAIDLPPRFAAGAVHRDHEGHQVVVQAPDDRFACAK